MKTSRLRKWRVSALLLALAALGLNPLRAQDTIWAYPRSNYLYDCYINEKYPTASWNAPIVNGGGGAVAKRVNMACDTVRVVGIAAAMHSRMDYCSEGRPPEDSSSIWFMEYHYNTYDTTYNNCFEYLCLYEHVGDSMRVIDSVMVHRQNDIPTCVIKPLGNYDLGALPHDREIYYYLYEKYFESPITLTDSFYVGVTQYTSSGYVDAAGGVWQYRTIPLYLLNQQYRDMLSTPRVEVRAHQSFDSRDGTRRWRFYYYGSTQQQGFYFIFPIVAADSGEVSIETVERMTELYPNPAADRVTLASSFGISGVSVYNTAGTLVLERLGLAGTMYTLDISALPAGAYLLHLRTPVGTAVKKLLVR